MKRIIKHVENLKSKPHHIRKKAAFSVAGGITGLVALVWLSTSLATGAFAIQGSSFAESTGQNVGVEQVYPDGSQVAGAAAAFPEDSKEPRIQIVNVAATSSPATPVQTNETIITF